MSPRLRITVLTVAVLIAVATLLPSAQGKVAEHYVGPHFGDGNIAAGCVRSTSSPANGCFHLRTGLNGLDSPSIDVAVLVPVSPTVERDRRIMKQAVELWEGGIHYLADQMGMAWLRDGVKFNINVDEVVTNPDGTLAEPVKLVDPEIVVIATNPVGGVGAGADPWAMGGQLGVVDGEDAPCTVPAQAFNMDAWRANPAMDDHHGDDGGVYVEDCGGGAGGNVCFAVNPAIDPLPGESDVFPLFNLITHELAHCLTLGHVGDGADGGWGRVPTNDIMSYSSDPPGRTKCVSTLDVEGFALRMSRFLDVNGDGEVSADDRLFANDMVGAGGFPFQVQHPADHWYASATGEALDCPQPDLGAVPGQATDWEPAPVLTTEPALSVPTIAVDKGGDLSVRGAALRVPANQPTATSGAITDPTLDSVIPMTDVLGLSATVSPTSIEAVIKLDGVSELPTRGNGVAYALHVDDRRFDAYLDENGSVVVLDRGINTFTWGASAVFDAEARTITFRVNRDYLAQRFSVAPYKLAAVAGTHATLLWWVTYEDRAPDTGSLHLTGPELTGTASEAAGASTLTGTSSSGSSPSRTVVLEHEGGNTFTPADTSAGEDTGTQHEFTLPITSPARVRITLGWDDATSDLDLKVPGGIADTGAEALPNPEVTVVELAREDLTITVDPYVVTGVPTTYTLTATIEDVDPTADGDQDGVADWVDTCPTTSGPATNDGCPDTDRDTMRDVVDRCPLAAGTGLDGCPVPGDESIRVLVDGKQVRSMFIDTRRGRYDFDFTSRLSGGRHTVKVVWYAKGDVVASVTQQVRR